MKNISNIFTCFLIAFFLMPMILFSAETNNNSINSTQTTTNSTTKDSTTKAVTSTKIKPTETDKKVTKSKPRKDSKKKISKTTEVKLNKDSDKKVTKSTNAKKQVITNHQTEAQIDRTALTKAKAQSIINSINKNYSFLYDPTMNSDLMSDILANPQHYVILFLDREIQNITTAVLIKVFIKTNPNAGRQFVTFVRQGLYNNMKIFRLIPNYFLQTGDPTNSGYGGAGQLRKASINKKLHFIRGTVAFSNLNNLESDDSQFFITYNRFPWLDNKYSILGQVVYGMDLLENISGTYNNNGFLVSSIVIYKSIVLSDWERAGETLFKDYPEALEIAQRSSHSKALDKSNNSLFAPTKTNSTKSSTSSSKDSSTKATTNNSKSTTTTNNNK